MMLDVGKTTLVMKSIPADIWSVNVTVSGFASVTSLDVVKGVELAVDGVKSLVAGMVPVG
jgi:hypothetical protein